MNPIVEETNELLHYGTKFHSGRYPYGSGEDPYQHDGDFLTRVERMRKEKFTYTDEDGNTYKGDTAIAKSLGMTTSDFRKEMSWATYTRRELNVSRAKSLQEKGMGPSEIGREMGISESTVRGWLKPDTEAKMLAARNTAEFLKQRVSEKGMIDVGGGTEHELGISKERLELALYALEAEGYKVYNNRIEQVTNRGRWTTQKVLCPPETEYKDVYDPSKIGTVKDYKSNDGGDTFYKFEYPKSMDSKRLQIRYAEDGGEAKDGVIEIRRGVEDLSLGNSRYAQVRILVDDNRYLKGMALYSDDMPEGVDVVFNTNKTKDVAKMDVLKKITNDPDNPFGALIKPGGQHHYIDKDGNEQLGLINKKSDEGDWTDWKDALPSQFLSKQSVQMAKKQLGLAATDKQNEYNEICSMNNPTVKKYWLNKFAEECDSAAVHLQAAALPGQKYHVIIPVNTLKDNEVYAPQYQDGIKVALIRYPHAGTFEIPILTVNNKHAAAKKLLGTDIVDAVAINKSNADRLSGADFDGDTVMVIPTHDSQGRVKITSTPKLKGLEGFDPKLSYPEMPGMKYMKDPVTGKDNTQNQMGRISNLICDMTIAGATDDEMARAVRHSMVVIDAGKHKLNYKKSEIDNGISALYEKYQGHYDADGKWHKSGAATIISRAKGEETVLKRQGNPIVDPETGKLSYKTADDVYYPVRKYDKDTGEVVMTKADGKKLRYNPKDAGDVEAYAPVKNVDPVTKEVTYTNKAGTITYRRGERTQSSTRMMETDDAMTLVSPAKHQMELAYADYANKMKALANTARKEALSTPNLQYNAQAAVTYRDEVRSLMDKLKDAEMNRPRERAAQRLATVEVAAKKEADPTLKAKDIRKASQQAITKYRNEVGGVARRDRNISITDREWEAIQAGAISSSNLNKILKNADADDLRARSMPRSTTSLSSAKVAKIKAMKASGNYSLSEMAAACGVSTATVSKYLKGEN